MRRILGIDPGSRITGFAIIEQATKGAKPICVLNGCIRLEAKEMPLRLAKLFADMQEIVKKFKPTELAIEQVFVHKNPRSALILGQARGVAIAAAVGNQLPVFEYAPRQIKQAVIGRGNADKNQIQKMIQILFALPEKPQVDAADALAIALTHLHSISLEMLQGEKILGARSKRRKTSTRSANWNSYDRTASRKDS